MTILPCARKGCTASVALCRCADVQNRYVVYAGACEGCLRSRKGSGIFGASAKTNRRGDR